jgi:hypothetical protein
MFAPYIFSLKPPLNLINIANTLYTQSTQYSLFTLAIKMTDSISFVFCPSNFPRTNQVPSMGEIVSLQKRKSDHVDEYGIALLSQHDGHFMGWINKEHVSSAEGHLQCRAEIRQLESFQWRVGGGTCYRGFLRFGRGTCSHHRQEMTLSAAVS